MVVRQVLDPGECASALGKMWDWFEGLGTGISRDDRGTWGDDRWPPCIAGSILPYFGIGQSRAMWAVRAAPKVRKVFAQIWGVEESELIASFDGASLFRPGRPPSTGWLHVDQHPSRRPDFDCVQGLVNLLPMAPELGGNVLIPRSHAGLAGLAERHAAALDAIRADEDLFQPPEDDPIFERAPVMTHLEPGDLLLWDSRTVHCNQPGLAPPARLCSDRSLGHGGELRRAEDARQEEEALQGHGLLRVACFVCMVPRARATADVLEARAGGVQNGLTTTHRPHVLQSSSEYDHWRRAVDEGRVPKGMRMPHAQLRVLDDMTQEELRLVGAAS